MLADKKDKYFEIIREDIFTNEGNLVYENYLEEYKPYANYGAITLLGFGVKSESETSIRKQDKKFEAGDEVEISFVFDYDRF